VLATTDGFHDPVVFKNTNGTERSTPKDVHEIAEKRAVDRIG